MQDASYLLTASFVSSQTHVFGVTARDAASCHRQAHVVAITATPHERQYRTAQSMATSSKSIAITEVAARADTILNC